MSLKMPQPSNWFWKDPCSVLDGVLGPADPHGALTTYENLGTMGLPWGWGVRILATSGGSGRKRLLK